MGDDYHDVPSEKFKALLAFAKQTAPRLKGLSAFDAQPAMDKAWAVRAGVGWIGKQTTPITRDYGSWVFLGDLLLDLELRDAELPDAVAGRLDDWLCGRDTCQDVCPWNCIEQPTDESRSGTKPVSNAPGAARQERRRTPRQRARHARPGA